MATLAERKALVFLAAIAALGVAVRGVRAGRERRADTDGVAALARQITAVDSASAAAAARRRPKSPVRTPVRAAAPTVRARPAPGPSPARAYSPARTSPAASPVDVSPPVRAYSPARTSPAASPVGVSPPVRAYSPARTSPAASPVDVDEAGADEIATIPGIGPVLAARIVDDRRQRGPFGSLAGLQRVKGIGPGVAGRIARYVRFSHPLAAPPVVTEFPKIRRRPKSP